MTSDNTQRLDKKINDQAIDLDIRLDGLNDKIHHTNDNIQDFRDLHESTLNDFKQVKKDFAENKELLEINLRRMGKDKRNLIEKLMKNFDLLVSSEN